MDDHDFFLFLPLILLSVRLFAELAVRIQVPPVIGEMLAGVILGPSLLGWVEPGDAIRHGRDRYHPPAVRCGSRDRCASPAQCRQ